jgi:MoxR-like ATPase
MNLPWTSRATRGRSSTGMLCKEMVNWGAGPRASICLILAAKARAILHGRYHTTTEDVSVMALPVPASSNRPDRSTRKPPARTRMRSCNKCSRIS